MAAIEWRGDTVGALRLLPLLRGLSSLEALLSEHLPPDMVAGGWEFGRFVLDSHIRGGPELVGRCAFLGVRELVRRTGAEHVFASCSPAHARLYRRFGFNELAAFGRLNRAYCVVRGEAHEILRATRPVASRLRHALAN